MIEPTMKTAIFAILLLASFMSRGPATPVAPYPHSEVIREIQWHWETYTNAAIGSDLWPITWGPDDNLYTAWGDGGGFGGSDQDARVSLGIARIEGSPEHWQGININGGKHSEHPATFPTKGKTGALIFVHGTLYASVNLQDGTWPNVNHELASSTNYGATWTMAGWRFPKGNGVFQPSAFLNFGKDYTGTPQPLAGYLYLYGVKRSANPQVSGRTYLARVPVGKITEHAAYEFFSGEINGKATWTTNGDQAVFTDPNSAGICSAVYAPALKRYLIASFHRGPGQLGVFDSPNPWGPWTTVCYYENFGRMDAAGEGLICSFPQKWMSPDGLTLWSIFSCYGPGAKTGIYGHDRFNVIKATLQLYPGK
jgi:Domain of unknown function (DUF4185)